MIPTTPPATSHEDADLTQLLNCVTITNERQKRISLAKSRVLTAASDSFDLKAAAKRTGVEVVAASERWFLECRALNLASGLARYDTLRSGAVRNFDAPALDQLPALLVKARVARGLTQRQLAEKLCLKEQQIQRYESGHYGRAGLKRLVEVADALGLDIRTAARLR